MTNNQQNQISYTGPFITMVFLFFIVGFLTVVNQQFQSPLQGALLSNVGGIQNTLAVMVTFAWFLSYPLTGGIGARMVNKHGYKNTMIRALFVVAAGCAIFEASVLLQKYSDGAAIDFGESSIPYAYFLFLIGAYVVGAGVTIMQVVINPYLIACKVKGTSDVQRQNIGGSSNSIGTTLAPFFVGGIIFGGASVVTLDNLIIPFIAFIVVILLVAFIITKLQLPNIANTTAEGGEKLERSVWSFRHLTLGVVAIFIYVGVEVCVGANLIMNAKAEIDPTLTGDALEKALALVAKMGSLYWGGMLVGRLIGSAISKVPARTQLIVTSIAAAVLVIGAMVSGNMWWLVAVGLFHSVMWPSTFALAVKGLGKYTSAGSGALMIGVLGGGVMPLLQAALADWWGGDWTATWIIVIIGEAYLLYYALLGSRIRKQDLIAE